MAMLNILRRIVQEVSSAENLDQSLKLVVSLLKQAMHVDVCSIYLILPETSRLTLVATDGLHAGSIGQVSMGANEGLVGLVAKGSEPLNVCDAPNHPAFKAFPDTGEEHFKQFLGVPILHHRRSLGVLVTQQEGDCTFEDDYVALMVTLAAQLGGVIRSAEVTGELLAHKRLPRRDIEIEGIAGAPGVAVGTAVVIFPEADLDAVPERAAESVAIEKDRFNDAIRKTQEEMRALKARMGEALPAEDQAVFDAYMLMLSGDSLVQGVLAKIEAGRWAPAALRA
ncbi:MAG TPA: GAF domain-containing protein, partial [Gammaproteobacteria bacterium]|nr:GAF domain-containing protein [Gammaproteobacteria bacterium]